MDDTLRFVVRTTPKKESQRQGDALRFTLLPHEPTPTLREVLIDLYGRDGPEFHGRRALELIGRGDHLDDADIRPTAGEVEMIRADVEREDHRDRLGRYDAQAKRLLAAPGTVSALADLARELRWRISKAMPTLTAGTTPYDELWTIENLANRLNHYTALGRIHELGQQAAQAREAQKARGKRYDPISKMIFDLLAAAPDPRTVRPSDVLRDLHRRASHGDEVILAVGAGVVVDGRRLPAAGLERLEKMGGKKPLSPRAVAWWNKWQRPKPGVKIQRPREVWKRLARLRKVFRSSPLPPLR